MGIAAAEDDNEGGSKGRRWPTRQASLTRPSGNSRRRPGGEAAHQAVLPVPRTLRCTELSWSCASTGWTNRKQTLQRHPLGVHIFTIFCCWSCPEQALGTSPTDHVCEEVKQIERAVVGHIHACLAWRRLFPTSRSLKNHVSMNGKR